MSQFAKKKEGIGLGFNTKTLKQQSSTNFFQKTCKRSPPARLYIRKEKNEALLGAKAWDTFLAFPLYRIHGEGNTEKDQCVGGYSSFFFLSLSSQA